MRHRGLVASDIAVIPGRTLVFALLAAILGAYIYFVERPRMADEAAPDLLIAFDQEAVTELRLLYPDDPDLRLERLGDADWRLREPIDADADDAAVDRLLAQIADTKVERRITAADAEDPATYGLADDGTRVRLKLALADGTALPDIVVGGTTPVGYNAFARVEGRDEIVVTPLLFHTGVKKSVFDLRNKRLFTAKPGAAIAMTLEIDGTRIELSRAGDRWQIDAPVKDRADRAQVDSMLSALNSLDATAFYDGDEVDREAFALDRPTLRLRVELAETESIGFRLGARSEEAPVGYYLERESDGQVAKIDEAMRNRFAKDLDALRDKHLFDCAPSRIAQMSFERADGDSFALKLGEDGAWSVEPPIEGLVREGMIKRTRSGLTSLAGQSIVADDVSDSPKLALYGLDTPTVEVTLELSDGTSCGRGLAGVVTDAAAPPAYYIKRADDGTIMSVPEYLFSRLDVRPSDFIATPEAEE